MIRTRGRAASDHARAPGRGGGRAGAASCADLPRPRIACLVGGSNRRGCRFTAPSALRLAQQASALAREPRRQPAGHHQPAHRRRLRRGARGARSSAPRLLHHRSRPTADNPYLGLLGAADAIIVTADSASMCTEACASGRPVFLFRPAAGVSGQARPAARRARGGRPSAAARRRLARALPAAARPGRSRRRGDPRAAVGADRRSRAAERWHRRARRLKSTRASAAKVEPWRRRATARC